MIFEHGFFHADPHPGNILAQRDGRIALLDFGLAKELPSGFGAGVARMIAGAMGGDAPSAVAAARSIGFSIREGDPARFVELIRMILGEYGAGGRGLVAVLQTGVVESVPSHFALVVRALVLLNGLSHRLVPDQRVIAMAVAGAVMRQVMAAPAGASAGAGSHPPGSPLPPG
jgi:ubiquinone biosynthesis protein